MIYNECYPHKNLNNEAEKNHQTICEEKKDTHTQSEKESESGEIFILFDTHIQGI
jgi:hypothetical protein